MAAKDLPKLERGLVGEDGHQIGRNVSILGSPNG
jgi:hypothetical protein